MAQPAVQRQRFELVERAAHVFVALPMRLERHRGADLVERSLQIIDPPPIEFHHAQVTALGQIGQALRDILVVDAGARCRRQQAPIPPQVVGRPVTLRPLPQALCRRPEVRLDVDRAGPVLGHQHERGEILPAAQIQATEDRGILEDAEVGLAAVQRPHRRC